MTEEYEDAIIQKIVRNTKSTTVHFQTQAFI